MRTTPPAPRVEPLEPRTLFAAPPGPGDTLPDITDTAADAAGHVYRAGTFTGTLDFDPSTAAAFNLTAQSTDNYVAKFAANGTLLWAVRFGSAEVMGAPKLGLGPTGTVYVASDYGAPFDANPSDSAAATLALRGTERNVYLIRLNTDGRFVRANAFATPGQDLAATDVAAAPDGHVVLVTHGLVPGIANPVNWKGDAHYYLLSARLRTQVHHRWTTTTSIGVVDPTSMMLGPSGETYIAGATAPGVDFAPGRRVRTVSGPTLDNPFLLRIEPTGRFDWVITYNFPFAPVAPTIEINRVDATTIDVSGAYTPNFVDFNPSPRKSFVLTGPTGTYTALFSPRGALISAQDTTLPPT